jgi:hypothetical protein
MSSNSLSSIQTPWKLTHCGGMGPHSEKCWITTPNSHLFWIIECYCEKGGPIWKGKDNLSFLGEIVWSWHEQAFMNIMNVATYTIIGFCMSMICQKTSCWIFCQTTQMLCTLVCVIEMTLNIYKRWLHFCMDFPKNKMPLTQGKHVQGWPQKYFLFKMN